MMLFLEVYKLFYRGENGENAAGGRRDAGAFSHFSALRVSEKSLVYKLFVSVGLGPSSILTHGFI